VTEPFDVCGPLPAGVTVLEASAGTGKTYTIAALAARYVAAGTPLDQLLLVTFTRMATGELRERVRERLVDAERALGRATAPSDDAVVRLLAQGDREEVAQRRERLARALADFDAATIATTHGFCQEVLGGLGVAGDVERDAVFVEDVTDLVDEVVDDLYVRRFFQAGSAPFTRAEARRIAAVAVANPGAAVEPADGDGTPAMRRRLAVAVREELERRKHVTGVMTYDDQLTRLHRALTGPSGVAVARRLRERWRVVLVDEFQDTDPIQWDIMRRAFGAGTLVLIGDPKQAIYAFRGADVFAYLDAAREATTRATLEINWRSDQGLIDAYDALFGGARLGHEGIAYRTVRATEANQAPRLRGAPHDAPLRIRVVDRGDVRTTGGGYASAPSAREHIAADLAADLVALLSS
jgi:exodeoxyribonuclease V beta subunit